MSHDARYLLPSEYPEGTTDLWRFLKSTCPGTGRNRGPARRPLLRCRRNSPAASSSGFRREPRGPEHRSWPADTFNSKMRYHSHRHFFRSTWRSSFMTTRSASSRARCSGQPGTSRPAWLTTLWHGYSPYSSAMPSTFPTSLAFFSLPIRRAIWPYVATRPSGISSTTERISYIRSSRGTRCLPGGNRRFFHLGTFSLPHSYCCPLRRGLTTTRRHPEQAAHPVDAPQIPEGRFHMHKGREQRLPPAFQTACPLPQDGGAGLVSSLSLPRGATSPSRE